MEGVKDWVCRLHALKKKETSLHNWVCRLHALLKDADLNTLTCVCLGVHGFMCRALISQGMDCMALSFTL